MTAAPCPGAVIPLTDECKEERRRRSILLYARENTEATMPCYDTMILSVGGSGNVGWKGCPEGIVVVFGRR